MLHTITEHQEVLKTIEDHARTCMKQVHSSHGWDHVERVVKLCNHLSETYRDLDTFVLKAAALLHDISRIEEDRSEGTVCHAITGSKTAYEFLKQCNIPDIQALHVADSIRTHRFRDTYKPGSLEAELLYDADKLDSIGAVGIGRAFIFSGEIGARLHNKVQDVTRTDAYSDEDTAYREYCVKLRYVKDHMLTNAGKKMAIERHRFMEIFFNRFNNEVAGLL